MSDNVKEAARAAESNTPFRVLARAGFAANGFMHVLIGVIVLVAAFGGEGETDQAGAFKAVAAAPLGFAALWALAAALGALGVWHAAEGILARGGPRSDPTAKRAAKKWGLRASEWGQALVFLALGAIAAAVALGARPNGDDAAQGASRGILEIPGGTFLLGAIGLGVGIGGISFFVMGVLRSFRKKMSIPKSALGRGVEALGMFGFLAKGVALLIVGVLLLVAAVRGDAKAAGGLDGAIQVLLDLPLGPWLAGTVGIGFLAYGVFCFFRARYARI